jgi:pyruvate-ferredoxin/flavodoxin oxidoreductase
VNFTSGQGILYGVEQYYHAPGKCSTMVLEVVARALTKHALNVHCGHDDVYGALDTGWIILFGKDAQQTADQALILRRVTELSLTPGMNCQDGFLTSHLERTFYKHESELIRLFLGAPDDIIACPTESQRILFGPERRRVPRMIDLTNPVLLGPVQNQENYMQGIAARRNNFSEPIAQFLEEAYADFGKLTGRYYGMLSAYKAADADTVFVSLGSAAENIEAAVDYLRQRRSAKVGSIHLNVIRPFPEAAVINALAGKKNVIVLERTDEAMAPGRGFALYRRPLPRSIRNGTSRRRRVPYRGQIPQPLQEGQKGPGGQADLGGKHARPHTAAGCGVSPLPASRTPLLRPRLRRLYQSPGRERRRRLPGDLAPARTVLGRASQSVADAPEQSGHRKQRLRSPKIDLGRCRCRKISKDELFARGEQLLRDRLQPDGVAKAG